MDSPTWSVYDGESAGAWGADAVHADVGLATCSRGQTLRDCGLKKVRVLQRGAQGAVYLAMGQLAPGLDVASAGLHATGETCEGDGSPSTARSHQRLFAVKRMYTPFANSGSRGVADEALREATIYRFLAAKRDTLAGRGSPPAAPAYTRQTDADELADRPGLPFAGNVVDLVAVVEAPHHELCLVLAYCPTDLSRLALLPKRAAQSPHLRGGLRREPPADPPRASLSRLLPKEPVASTSSASGVKLSQAPAERGLSQRETAVDPAPLPVAATRFVLRQLLGVLTYLHDECHIVHRDIKPSNILVTSAGTIRLSDFGSARFLLPSHLPHRTCAEAAETPARGRDHDTVSVEPLALQDEAYDVAPCGEHDVGVGMLTPPSIRTTLLYRSPECLMGARDYGTPADVWGVGVIFAEMLLRCHLFSANGELAMISQIWKLLGSPTPLDGSSSSGEDTEVAESTFNLKFCVKTSDEGIDLLRRMLALKPEERITPREALKHPFLREEGDCTSGEAPPEWLSVVHTHLSAALATPTVHPIRLGTGDGDASGDDTDCAAVFGLGEATGDGQPVETVASWLGEPLAADAHSSGENSS